jgi:antitoxin component of RelBE/YafQ-DinJ toxin-antitoxin module
MPATETIRIRVEPQLKHALQRRCKRDNTTLSQTIRDLLKNEASRPTTALERFDAIMQGSRQKTEASGLREPTIEDINRYIAAIRIERQNDMDKVS